MDIILFFTMLGVLLLLGACFGVLYLPDKAKLSSNFNSFNRVEKLLLKVHKPTLKIIISVLFIVFMVLSGKEAAMLDGMQWYVKILIAICFLSSGYFVAALSYVLIHPYSLLKAGIFSSFSARKNMIINIACYVLFVLSAIGLIIYVLNIEAPLNFILIPAATLLVAAVVVLVFVLLTIIKVLFVSEHSLVRVFTRLCQKYWNWVLKH